jgi:hypothetical protein
LACRRFEELRKKMRMHKRRRYAKRLTTMLAATIAGVLGCAFFAGTSAGGASRIALLAKVRISGDAILLANLLPEDVSGRVRELARGISLGNTPQNGSARTLRAAMVAETMERSGMAAAQFVIPEVISVERAGRLLSGEEILASLRGAVAGFSLSSGALAALMSVQAKDLAWESGLRVPLGDARLRVLDLAVELAAGQARFRVAAESEAHGVPFEVFARLPASKALLAGNVIGTSQAVERLVPASAPRTPATTLGGKEVTNGPVLVTVGKSARLRLHSQNSNILLEVQALQTGHAGETIRVRVLASGRTLRARVIGERQLDAIF